MRNFLWRMSILSFALWGGIHANAQVSGTVFRDFNADGVKASTSSTSLEPGVSGITVMAYPSSGAAQTTTTSSTGTYFFSGLTLPVRIEFTNLPTGNYTGPQGTSSGTTVQFYNAANSNANLGINTPAHYSQAAPPLVTPKYLNGDPFNDLGGNIANEDALYMYPFGANGDRQNGGTAATTLATQVQIGSTWGTAYDNNRKKLFVASVYKRHAPLGPGETGGRIYVIDNPTAVPGTPTKFIDLVSDLGISVGAVETNAARSLATNRYVASTDDNAFTKVGKVGLGDLDISDDGQFLFVVNLHDKKVYKINIAQAVAGTPNATALPAYTVPTCTNGQTRPWGMGMWGGELYLGIVCDASTGTRNDLQGYVQKFNFTTNTWTTVLNFTPTWSRGYSYQAQTGDWQKWEDTYTNFLYQGWSAIHPQPIIGDIEFDEEGSMHLALLDRAGFQLGHRNYEPFSTNLTTGMVAGEILRTYKDPSTGVITLENNGSSGPYTSGGTGTNQQEQGGVGTNQGPGGGEFYADDFTGNVHAETLAGGMALKKGSRIVASNHMDPIDGTLDATGTLWLSTVDGLETQEYQIFYNNGAPSPDFSKQNGLGDLEYLTTAAPIEVGNRVWNDTNKNGIQDAGEAGVAGVTIQLSKFNGTSYVNLVTCTTDANGNYYFSSATGTSATGVTYNVTELTPNSQFKLSIPTTYNGLMLTASNIVSGSNADEIDSDADGLGVISFTTGNAGENNHSYDIGFQSPTEICTGEEYTLSVPSGTTGQWYKDGLPIAGATGITYVVTTAGNYNFIGTNGSGCTFTSCTNAAFIAGNCARLGNYVWNDTNADGLNNEVASAGINGVKVRLYKDNGSGTYVLTDSVLTANKGSNPGYYQFVLHTFGNYKVQFVAPTGKNLTKTTQTANTDNNSDADGIGWSGVINMVAGANDSTIDAGFVNSCAVGNILYLCGNVKPADADAFDHGMIQYLQGLGNTITPALTQNVAGLGLYNPMTMVALGLTNLNGFDAVIVSPTVEGSYSPTLIDSLRKSRLPILASDLWASVDLGLTTNSGFNYQNDVYNGTSQVPFYNYVTLNPTQSYGSGVFWADYTNNATAYLWLDAIAQTNANQGVYFVYEPTDAINNPVTGSPLNNHGRRVFYGIHSNGIYENPTNGGSIPSPASAWLNPYIHLTSYGKRYLDSALTMMCTTKAPAGSIGNFVWTDADGDGTQDVGETGINGVKVKLYQDNGSGVYNLIDSTTTATNGGNAGYYAFTGLGSWNYYVQFPTTTGTSIPLSIQTTTAATDGNSDANVNTGNSPIFAINASGTGTAKDNPTIDAGYYYCGLSMVPGLTINTIAFGPQTAPQPETVTLNAGGTLLPESNVAGFYHSSTSEGALYTFCAEISQPVLPLQNPYTHELTGSANGFTAAQAYRVAQVVQAAGFNSQTGLGAGNNTVTNLVALQLACWNAIYDTDYSVTAGNFQSTTSNNVGAVALANTWLTAAQAITTPTSVVHKLHHASGQDLFETGDVPPITVQVTPPTCSGVGAPNNATMTVVGFSAGQRYQYSTGTTFNSAAATPASPTAIPVGGVVANNLANTTQTYTIRVYDATNDACFTDRTVAINSVICVGSVGNYVWTDTDGDGTQDVGETGINGVTVELYKETAPSSGSYALAQTTTTITNAGNAGYYNFVITQSANYYVHFPTTTSGKFLSTQTTTAATNGNSDANVSTGNSPIFAIDVLGTGTAKDNPTIDAGYHLGVIGNYVWYDTDRNGLQNEPASNGLNGETVLLWQVGNAFAVGSTTTANDANGNPGFYQFTGLAAGTYKVSFPNTVTLPNSATGYATIFDTTALVNGNSDIIPQMSNFTSAIVLAAGEVNNTIDAGFTDCANGGAGSGGQIGISTPTCFTPGASITFQTTNIAPYTLTSPVMQIWLVHLWSGGTANTYMYSTIDSLTFTHTITNTTGLDSIEIRRCVNTAGCAIASFESNIATLYPCKGSVGNYVWNDTDGDGTQDAGETGINGVTVELYKETSAGSGSYALAQTTTTANNGTNDGAYNFIISESANYYVKFPTTSGANVLTFQTITAATDGNSDANAITGNSPIFAINMNGVGAAKDNNTIDAGFVPLSACILDGITQDFSMAVNSIFINPTLANVYGYKESSAAIGREVDIFIQRNTTAASDTIWGVTSATTNEMGLQSSATAKGKVIFTYDGVDGNANALDATGLGHLNMSGNSNGFSFNYTATGTALSPSTVTAKVRVYTDASNWSTQSITLTQGLNMTTYIPVSFSRAGFTVGAGTGVNWSNVGAVEIEIETATNGAEVSIKDVKMPCYITGTVGNYVWIDTNGDGLQNEPTSNGVNGVTVELWTAGNNGIGGLGAGTDMLMATTTTANDGSGNPGYYNFNITNSGNHFIKFPATVNGKVATTQIATAGTDGNNDISGAGVTPMFVMDLGGTGVALNNPTLDAGYKTFSQSTLACDFLLDSLSTEFSYTGKTNTNYTHIASGVSIPFGGERDILISDISRPSLPTTMDYSIYTGTNILDFASAAGMFEKMTIQWDGIDNNATSLNYTGLGGLDFQSLNMDKFTFELMADFPPTTDSLPITLQLWSNAGAGSQTTQKIKFPNDGNFRTVTFNLNTMTAIAGSGVDLSNIGAIQIQYDMTLRNGWDIAMQDYRLECTPLGSIGNYVWSDTDADGTQDAGETGINGVTVELYKETAPSSGSYALAQTTTTATNGASAGYYNFVITESANYYVHFPTTNGVNVLSPATTTAATDGNSDANISTGNSPIFAMDINGTGTSKDNPTIDAGFKGIGSVGNYVWNDTDGDGTQDVGETGINGVTVELYKETAPSSGSYALAQTTTTANDGANDGAYNFVIVESANYYVHFPTTTSGKTLSTSTTTAATDGNSDANVSTGNSPIFAIDINGVGTAKDNPTIDAGFKLMPIITAVAGSCDPSANQYNVAGTITGTFPATGQMLVNIAGEGSILYSAPFASSPISYSITGLNSDGANKTVTITFTDAPDLNTSVNYTAPTACITNSCVSGGAGAETHTYTLPFTTTDVVNQAVTLPKFDDMGGTRILEKVLITQKQSTVSAALLENTSAGIDSFFLQLNTKGLLSMAGDTLLFSDYSANYNNELPGNVFVPTNGAYPSWLGDINQPIGAGFVPSTLARMEISSTVVTNDLPNFIDPRLNSGWVTNITGDATHDDDIWYVSPLEMSRSSSKLLTTALSNYIGTGNLAMIANADAGHSLQGGGGNMVFDLRTKYKTEVTVTYYYCPAAKVGNYVWTDTDADGTQDGSETGINGVTVELYKETAPSSGTYALAQTTTTANDGSNDGAYSFVITESANYYVHFPLVSGVDILTTQTTTAATDGNSDANISTGNSPIFAMDVNGTGIAQDNQTIDAGYTPVSSTVGDYVWLDIDKDGQQDANEKGVSGVTVSLINNLNEVVATTQTDAYGYYLFHNVAVGDYTVRFSLPIAYTFTIQEPSPSATGSDANGAGYSNTFHVNAGDNITDIDAGIYYEKVFRSGLGNFVWLDVNANGRQDVGELGVSNVAVMLYNTSGTLLQATLTNNAGYYQFLDLTAGNYVVGVRLPLGYQFVNPNVGGNDNVDSDILPSTGKTATIVLPVNTFDQSNDAGIVAIVNTQASIGDYVWNDANHNGLQESDEVGVSNVTVELWDDQNSLVQTTRTDAYGYYMFTDITAGFYSVKFELPAGWVFSTADVGTDNDIDSDVITPIGGTDTIRVAEGDRITNVDAGVYNPAATTKGIIGDYVWYDLDKDGIQDGTEAGVPGVMVTLYDGSNFVIAQTTTDQNGKYLFIDLPVGTYSVGFSNIREGYTFTTPTQGGDGTLDSDVIPATGKTATVSLTSNAIILDLDAGIYPTTRGGGYASLGDRVWYDVNNNGLQNTGEVGAANIIVRLYDATSTQVGLTLTDGSGRYLFSGLTPGTYTVNFTLPSGYAFSPQKQGTNDNTDSDVNILGTTAAITLMAGENNMRIDAGLYKSTGTASIGDFVWNDINNDGAQNVGEKGVSGVSVTLYNASGIAIATTVTDKNGYYLFPYMNAANYSVGFNNFPAGFALVPAGQGGDSSTDSDPNVVTGKTAVFSLAAGQAKTDIDAGLYAARASLGDYVWNDVNVNGLQDVTEEGVAGITVHLFNSSNQYISSSVTDANGYYLFYNLTAGNYYVNVSDLPTYTVFTVSNAGDDAIDSDINPVTALSQTVTLAANDFNKTVDAGLNMDANASLEGYVWFDANGDGLQDVTEAPVSGVLVTLESPTGVALSRTVSGADGMYHFENVVEGSYKVRFSNIPTGSRFTASDVNGGNNDRLDSDANPTTGLSIATYPILSGQRAHAADAGLLPPGSIAGTAFEDAGTPPNGLQDQMEITFSNILVMLYTSADSVLVGTTLTDKKGNYLFTGLYQDNYFVVFDAIGGRSFTAKNIDNNLSDDIDSDVNFFGGTDVINLGVGENIINVDAGYLPAGFIFPVTMAYFTAELVNTDGLLKWKTTAEVNTKHFEIYRSLDEFSYEKIGNNVTATGTPTTSTSYNTFDYNVNKLNVDRVFYRLKIIDVDGSFNWSNVVALNLTHTDQTIFAQVYPNPAETMIWVDYQLFDGETADLKITNSVGQAVYTETIKAKDSLQQLSIDISKWADGVYYLNIQSENGNFVRKIIKE